MAQRACWQGQIRLALVSIAVEIHPATRSGRSVSFRQIHEPTGKPVHYEKTVAGVGPVDPDDILKGYEVSRGNYVLLDQDEIDAVRIESRRTLDLVQFVATDEIDVLYYEKPYFVLPADELAEDAYAVLREALRASRKAGLGQLSVRGREQLVALQPCGRGLILEVLRYADEVVAAQSCFRGLPDEKVDPEMLELATAIIDRRTAPFRPAEFHDRYVDALHRLIDDRRKAHGERILEEAPAPAGGRANVIDLMAALRQSAAGDGAKPSRPARARARAAPPKRTKTG